MIRLFAFSLLLLVIIASLVSPATGAPYLPLDSRVYPLLGQLAGAGLITSDFWGLRPFSRTEALRLLREAEETQDKLSPSVHVTQLLTETARLLDSHPLTAGQVAVNPLTAARLRTVYNDGSPRTYERQVHDPGGDGVFGIGGGLRPNTPNNVGQQVGRECTPLMENTEGTCYRQGTSGEVTLQADGAVGNWLAAAVEPQLLANDDGLVQLRLNRGYMTLGGGGLELEVGRDAAWFGFGERGAITLSNNAKNFDLVKLSSPEPIDIGFFGKLKYALLLAQLDRTITYGETRQPLFFGAKVSVKPVPVVEVGLNLGRQVGGPGVNNSFASTMRGLIGGTGDDNSNTLAGLELRWRLPGVRNLELFGEFSGEDSAAFWPTVESYLAGFFLPRLTDDGRNDLRFEYFQGHQILYTNATFPEGYLYEGLPIGHFLGGGVQDYHLRYRYWFSARMVGTIDYAHTERGRMGRVAGQVVEQGNSWRGGITLPLGDYDIAFRYSWQHVNNLQLVDGQHQTNQLAVVDFSYRY